MQFYNFHIIGYCILGLYVDKDDGKRLLESGFDGLYTYFGADGFTYGSTAANWPEISIFCTQNQLLFVPSVSPGSNDTQIRPWNSANAHARKDGEYYREHFRIAHASKVFINPVVVGTNQTLSARYSFHNLI